MAEEIAIPLHIRNTTAVPTPLDCATMLFLHRQIFQNKYRSGVFEIPALLTNQFLNTAADRIGRRSSMFALILSSASIIL